MGIGFPKMTTFETGKSISIMDTVKNTLVSTESNDAEDTSKKKEEEELEKLAMEEILTETKRRAETAKEFGALGWQKSPLLPVNKQFLKTTLVSTLRSVPDIKKEKKLRDLQIWKNPEHKRNYRHRNLDNDADTTRSRHRDPSSKPDERTDGVSKDKDSSRRFRISQPDRHARSRLGDKHSHPKRSRESRSSKNSSNLEKNDVKPEASLAESEEKMIDSIENGCKENHEAKSDLKNDSLTFDAKETAAVNDLKTQDGKESVVVNDLTLKDGKEATVVNNGKEMPVNELRLKDKEQNVQSEHLHVDNDRKGPSRSHKRKRSKDRSDKTSSSSKKRKHHSKHKKDGDKKHKSKRKSKKHKKKDSEI